MERVMEIRILSNSSAHRKGAKVAKKKNKNDKILQRRSIFYSKITMFSKIFSRYFPKNNTFASLR